MYAENTGATGDTALTCAWNLETANVGCLLALSIKPSAATGQFARPAADRTDGNWVSQVPSSLNLYQSIDETSYSDADYIRSGATPSNDTCTIDLSSIATPQAGTVTLRIRTRAV